MSRVYGVTVVVRRRDAIADPQGTTVAHALADLGFDEVRRVRVDRTIRLDVEGGSPEEVRARVDEMCRRLLVNPVMEDYDILLDAPA